uniref:C2H2-type domain-containing protein n=1 Tax=Cacopsylla melanoneura TaxID=428564 RepID=A0A8D8VJ11_9HEMI
MESNRIESGTLDNRQTECAKSKAEIPFDQKFKCETCSKEFTSEFEYNKHKVLIHAYNAFLCHICYVSFVEKWKLEIHLMSEEHLALVSNEAVQGVEASQTRITRRSKRSIVDTNTPEKEPTSSRNTDKMLNKEKDDCNSSACFSPKKDSKRNKKESSERINVEKVKDTQDTSHSVKCKTKNDSTKSEISNKTEQLSSECASKGPNDRESEHVEINKKSSERVDEKLTDKSTNDVDSTDADLSVSPPSTSHQTNLDYKTENQKNDAQKSVENIATVSSSTSEKSVVEVQESELKTSENKDDNLSKTSSDGTQIVETVAPSSLPGNDIQVSDKPSTPLNQDDLVPNSSKMDGSRKNSENYIEIKDLKMDPTTIPYATKESEDKVSPKREVPATSSMTETSGISLDLDLLELSIPTSIITTKRLTIRKELTKNLEAQTVKNESVILGEIKAPQMVLKSQVDSTASVVKTKKNLRPLPKLRPLPNLIKISPENLKLIPTIKANILNKKDVPHLRNVIVKDNKANVDNPEQIIQDNEATVIEQEKESRKSQCNTILENCENLLDINTVVANLSTSVHGFCVGKFNPVQTVLSVDHDAKKMLVSPDKTHGDSLTTSKDSKTIALTDSKTMSEGSSTTPEDSITASDDSKATAEDSKTASDDSNTVPKDSMTASDDSKIVAKDSMMITPEDSKTTHEDSKTASDDSKRASW